MALFISAPFFCASLYFYDGQRLSSDANKKIETQAGCSTARIEARTEDFFDGAPTTCCFSDLDRCGVCWRILLLCFPPILAKIMWKRPQKRGELGDHRNWRAPKLQRGEDEEEGRVLHNRYLELADVALGLKKPRPGNKKPVASAGDFLSKTESYKKA